MKVSWSTGSIDWSCHGKDVPLSRFSTKRRKTRVHMGPKTGQFRLEAPCPKCDNHWVTVGWKEGE